MLGLYTWLFGLLGLAVENWLVIDMPVPMYDV